MVVRGGTGVVVVVWAKWAKVVKKYKFSVTKEISLRDVTYSMVMIVNNTVLCI